jgi:hypothetical protein
MAGTTDGGETGRLPTLSTDQRRLIGQAIIDGLLSPTQVAVAASMPDYNQAKGDYTQRGGGGYTQGGGNYNQAPKQD